jgi:hypothetical protein
MASDVRRNPSARVRRRAVSGPTVVMGKKWRSSSLPGHLYPSAVEMEQTEPPRSSEFCDESSVAGRRRQHDQNSTVTSFEHSTTNASHTQYVNEPTGFFPRSSLYVAPLSPSAIFTPSFHTV